MPDRYKKILMWALYAALMLAAALLQTVVFGRVRYFGAKLSLLPVVLACVCMHTEPEPAGLFGLLTGLGWYACGADGAGLSILTFTAVALGVSWLCRQYPVSYTHLPGHHAPGVEPQRHAARRSGGADRRARTRRACAPGRVQRAAGV